MHKIVFVVGTRPEIIKMAPVILLAEERNLDYIIIHTGQHYDENMSDRYFKSLGIRIPDENLGVGGKSSVDLLHEMIQKLSKTLRRLEPKIVLALGDTISVLATCLTCVQNDIPFGHLEAGLRSFDLTMPEERNRRIVDSISTLYFAPSETAVTNLYYEGIDPERIFLTGNTIVDAIRIFKEKIKDADVSQADKILSSVKGNYILCTVHRVSNVENIKNLKIITNFLWKFKSKPIIFIVHPRTLKKLDDLNLDISESKTPSHLHISSSVDYLSMLKLLSSDRCLLVLTDSGGLQEEAAILRKPCITLRSNTERPETVIQEINLLVKIDESEITEAVNQALIEDFTYRFETFGTPYGDGNASKKILNVLEEKLYEDLGFKSPTNFEQGAKTFHLLELGSNMEKSDIENQFRSQVSIVYDDNGNPKVIENKLKKGDRVRILRD